MTHITDLAHKAMAVGFKQTMKEEIKNREGRVSMAMIGAEAVSILVLIVVFMIIPFIGQAISNAMGNIDVNSPWANAPNGTSLWSSVAPILQTACIVVVVGLILKVIYDLRQNQKDNE